MKREDYLNYRLNEIRRKILQSNFGFKLQEKTMSTKELNPHSMAFAFIPFKDLMAFLKSQGKKRLNSNSSRSC